MSSQQAGLPRRPARHQRQLALGLLRRRTLQNFQRLAGSYGAAAMRVDDAAELTATLRTALAEPRPTLIEIVAADFATRT